MSPATQRYASSLVVLRVSLHEAVLCCAQEWPELIRLRHEVQGLTGEAAAANTAVTTLQQQLQAVQGANSKLTAALTQKTGVVCAQCA